MTNLENKKKTQVYDLKKTALALTFSALAVSMPMNAVAESANQDDIWNWPGITGPWDGGRDSLEKSGITFEAVYTGEFDTNFTANPVTGNGQKGTVYQTNTDISLTLDTEAAGWWPGGTLFVYGLVDSGTDPTSYSGDLQAYSNIEAPNQSILHEAWYEQNFADGMFSVLAGFHDLNSEFYASDYGALFLNSSFGIGPELSGNVPASLFPQAALGARVRVAPTDNFHVQVAMYDGDPVTRSFKSAEGKMWIAETAFTTDTGAYKVGYWQHTAQKTFGASTFSNDSGAYGVIDQQFVELETAVQSVGSCNTELLQRLVMKFSHIWVSAYTLPA